MPTYTKKEGDVTVTYTQEEYFAKQQVDEEEAMLTFAFKAAFVGVCLIIVFILKAVL